MQPVTAMVGSTVFINATVTGTVPFSFQWYFNGQPISNPTTQDNLGFEVGNVNGKEQNLVIANVQLSNVGTYSVTVSNPGGSSSGSAALTLFQGYDVATLVGPSGSPLSRPGGIGVDAAGNVYVADSNDYTIRKITPQGVVTVLAGMAGIQGSTDGTGSTARFAFGGGPLPNLAVDKMGDVYVADTENDTIRMITPSGVVTTLAGAAGVRGNADGTGSSALFNQPTGAAVDGSGNVYVADQGNGTVRMIAPGGVVTTLAGGGPGSLPESGGTGSSVYFDDLTGIAVDGSGNLYVTDAAASTIRKITPAGVVTTMAGGSSPGGISGSTDGVGTNALFNLPNGIAADAAGNVYVVDTNNATVRAITPGGSVTTLAGAAGGGYADGVGVSALFSRPVGIAVDASGVLYVADAFNNAVRECTSLAALAAPVITQQMASQTVAAGSTVIFAVTATGSFPFAYQWFLNGSALTDGNGTSGSATASLVITNAQPASAGSYAVSVSNAAGIVMAASATLAVDTAPSITTPPSSQTLMAGGSATFTVAASGNPSPSYLWQVSTNGGSTWTALTDGNGVSGSATVTLTLSNVSASLSGNQYQCVATNSVNSVTSTPVALTVNTAPAITSQPSSDTVTAGNNASFTVAASGSPSPTYQWQVSTNGGGTWTALTDGSGVSGSATAALTLSNTAATLNGYEYQCVVTNSVTSVTTNPVSLAVDFAPSITTQPSGATVTAGSNATFAVTASGNPAANFQWVISTNGGATFSKLTDDNSIAGSTTATLTISGVEASLNGNEYECKVTNSVNSVTTTPVTLVVDTAPGIATQPGPETVTFGSNASFTVVATGNPTPIYQWEISSNGGTTWTNLMDGGGVSGSSTATLTLSSAAAALNGNQYQCVVTNSVSSVTTTPVLLVVDTAPSFTTEPVSDTITVGGSASFTVAATGNPLPTYIWEVSTNGGSTWAALSNGNGISGATTATLTIIGAAASLNGAEYECVVTNSVNSVTTTPASLTVNVPPAITSQPVSQTVNAGSGVVMSVEATSNLPLTYQWFFDGTPMSGATGTALSLGNVTAADAGTYTVDVTSSAGTTPSSAATLTVSPAPTSSVITTQPMSQTVNQGGSVVFTVQPNGSLQSSLRAAVAGVTPEATSGTTYQWQFNGVNLSDGNGISGSTGPQLLIQGVGTSDNGDYDCIVTTGGTAVRSNSAGLQVEASSTPGSVSSISSRAFVGTGDNILIGGFYIVGSTSATVLVQAIGPALAAAPYNVTGTLQKPALTIHQNQNGKDVVLYSNTGWGSSPVLLAAAAAVYAEPVLQPNAPDSEVLLTLPPGGYTAEVTGADGGTGVALCGIYQLP
jgi:sugar lactone lactonase YvrE